MRFAFFMWIAAIHAAPYPIEDRSTTPILTPSFAERKVAKIRLENELEAYIISDPRAEKSAAALTVQVGSWEDPKDAPGMAHFVEHMLFLGTEKYPEESSFDRYVTRHGGQSNASTYSDHTNYMFSIDTGGFAEALDRFGSFFYKPLFNPSGVEREVQAIDQEFLRLVRSDDWRMFWISSLVLGNRDHPYSRFTAGNRETLCRVKREELIQWYTEHYSSNLMKVVVYSSLDIETLKNLVVDCFSPICNHRRKAYKTVEPLFGPKQSGFITFVSSLKETKTLHMSWDLPLCFIDSKADQMVCHLLGDEGKGSLLALLKREGLAEELSCGTSREGGENSILSLSIELTKKGVKQLEEVVESVFQTLYKIKEKPIPSYLFEELKRINLVNYQLQEPVDAFTLVSVAANGLHREEISTYPEKSYLLNPKPKEVAELLDYLSPQNVHLLLLAPHKELDQIEPIGGASFSHTALSEELLRRWEELSSEIEVEVPPPNPYILDQTIVPSKDRIDPSFPTPEMLTADQFQKFYYCKDHYYNIPEFYCYSTLFSAEVNQGDPKSAALADLYIKALESVLKERFYPANMAGLHVELSPATYGLTFEIYGYKEHAVKFIQEIVEAVKQLKISANQFTYCKEAVIKRYRNSAADSPLKRTIETLTSIVRRDYSTSRQKMQALQKIKYEDLLAFMHSLYEATYSEALAYGDLSREQAKQISATLRELTANRWIKRPKIEIADLSTLKNPLYLVERSKRSGNALLLLLESGPFSFTQQAVQNILSQAMKSPFFSTLRTKQQTGYVVANWEQEMERHLFHFFAVESDSHGGRDLLARFELFLEDFNRGLESAISLKEFEILREALVKKLMQPAPNLKSMGRLLGTLATLYQGDFSWNGERVKALQTLQYADFLEKSHAMLSTRNAKRIALITKGSLENYLEYMPVRGVKEMRGKLHLVDEL